MADAQPDCMLFEAWSRFMGTMYTRLVCSISLLSPASAMLHLVFS